MKTFKPNLAIIAYLILLTLTLTESRGIYNGHSPTRHVLYPPIFLHHPEPPLPQLPPPPPPPPPNCARLWDQFGGEIHFGLNQETGPLDPFAFVPVAVEVRERCILILVDTFKKVDAYMPTDAVGLVDQCPISYAYCESCLGKVPQFGGQPAPPPDPSLNQTTPTPTPTTPPPPPTCAIMYDAPFCSTTLGFAFEVLAEEEEPHLEPGLRRVSSLMVRDGCALEIYDEAHFYGQAASVIGTIHLLGEEWDNRIVSFKCSCNETESSTEPGTPPPTPTEDTTTDVTTVVTTEPSTNVTTPSPTTTTPAEGETTETPEASSTTPDSTPPTPPISTSSTTTTTEKTEIIY